MYPPFAMQYLRNLQVQPKVPISTGHGPPPQCRESPLGMARLGGGLLGSLQTCVRKANGTVNPLLRAPGQSQQAWGQQWRMKGLTCLCAAGSDHCNSGPRGILHFHRHDRPQVLQPPLGGSRSGQHSPFCPKDGAEG